MKKKPEFKAIFMENRNSCVKQIRNITLISICLNLCLAGLKYTVGYLGPSQAVIADATHSLSDLTTDFAVICGVQFWSAPPDKDHPYGHQRIETIVSVLIGVILASVAVGLAANAIQTLKEPQIQKTTWIAIIGPACSVVLKELMYRWTVRVAKRLNSSAVKANAWHQRSDALSSLPALIAVAAASFNPAWSFVDQVGALIVSVFIIKVAWDIVAPSLSELADKGVSDADRDHLIQIAAEIAGVKEIHGLRTRKLGSNVMVDLHVLVAPNITVRSGHDISEKVKEKLMKERPDVQDVVVHLEPWEC